DPRGDPARVDRAAAGGPHRGHDGAPRLRARERTGFRPAPVPPPCRGGGGPGRDEAAPRRSGCSGWDDRLLRRAGQGRAPPERAALSVNPSEPERSDRPSPRARGPGPRHSHPGPDRSAVAGPESDLHRRTAPGAPRALIRAPAKLVRTVL